MSSNTPPPGDPQDPQQPGGNADLPSYGSTPPPPGDGAGSSPPPSPGGGGYRAPPETNKKALWSMITGILGVLCCAPAGIAAIILSNIGKKEIAASGGRQTGGGMATAGLILGIIAIALFILGIIFYATGILSLSGSTSTSGF